MSALAIPSNSESYSASTLEQIVNYSHPGLICRLQKEMGITTDDAVQLFADTKRFLFLSATFPGSIGPTHRLDECWHNFILFTEDYTDFCHRYFGHYLHHRPIDPSESDPGKHSLRRTLEVARQVFGSDLSENWTASSAGKDPDKDDDKDDDDAFFQCDIYNCEPLLPTDPVSPTSPTTPTSSS